MLSEEQLEKIANPVPVDIGGTQSPIVTEMAIELLSLREQREALKKLAPVAEVVSKFGDPEAFGEREINLLIDLRSVPYGTQLFTAAKPAALMVEDINSKVDITCYSCRRFITFQQHAEADGFCPYCGVEIELDGITAEPVQFDPPAAK
ncbi:TPA: zinc-ribbon domain-containing protein [Yersinia enterocolitica]|nr:hypothetical protein [Yersinia enterocolitica]